MYVLLVIAKVKLKGQLEMVGVSYEHLTHD